MCDTCAASYGGTGFPSVEKAGNFDERFGAAIAADLMGHTKLATQAMDTALKAAAPGSAGWLVPVEPLLNVSANPEEWAPVLARLRARAA